MQGRMSTRGDKPAQAVSTLSARKCSGPSAIAAWLGGGWSTAGTSLAPPTDLHPGSPRLRTLPRITDLNVNGKAVKLLEATVGGCLPPTQMKIYSL